MTEFVIHTIPGSPFARAAMIALEEKRQPWRLSPLSPGSLRHPEHLARNPFGKMPVLEHGVFQLYETQAILRYLDRILPDPALTPADPERAARMDQLMNINDWYLFQGVCNVIGFQRVVGPRVLGLASDEAVIAAAMPKAHAVADELARLLGDQTWFTGEAISLADILLAPQLDFFRDTPEWEPLVGSRRNLGAWLARMNARPSLVSTTWDRVAAMARAA